MPTSTFPGLGDCVTDARQAIKSDSGSPLRPPKSHANLMERLRAHQGRWPEEYRVGLVNPLIDEIGAQPPADYLADREQYEEEEPGRKQSGASALINKIQAVLQRGEQSIESQEARALHEVIWDLYVGFLKAAENKDVPGVDAAPLAPLGTWGQGGEDFRIWTKPVTGGKDLISRCPGIVVFPGTTQKKGLLLWAILAHEVNGHAVIQPHTEVRMEIREILNQKIGSSALDGRLKAYWAPPLFLEAASDILSVLNMGPAAAVGLIGFLRGWQAKHTGSARLDNHLPATHERYPAMILRALMAEATVRRLGDLSDRKKWAAHLEAEIEGELDGTTLDGKPISEAQVRDSAEIVTETIINTQLMTLGMKSLLQIRSWNDHDQGYVEELRKELKADPGRPVKITEDGFYAPHAVAAAVLGAVSDGLTPGQAQGWMIKTLDAMHAKNKYWKPSAVPPSVPPGRRPAKPRPHP